MVQCNVIEPITISDTGRCVTGESDGTSEQLARLEERVKEEIGLVKTAEAESREKIN